ncbi:hypothetical protein I3760_15G111000 [Carya illinoinensis]|nr:hypothetical protein I3760_15G111000 [Carya illinoinensis]
MAAEISASTSDVREDNASASVIRNHEPGYLCIHKVLDPIRKSNGEAYTPQVISIGPFNCKNPKLQTMESFKHRYLKSFTERAPKMNLEDLKRAIKVEEESVRKFYSENIKLESDDFVNMILLDASFIIQYFWKTKTKTVDQDKLKPAWLRNRVELDLILLENQLPFFIIKKIYDIAFPGDNTSFIDLSFSQFQHYNSQGLRPGSEIVILHFTDLLRKFCLPSHERPSERNSKNMMKDMRSATQLDRAGLKFKVRKPSNSKVSPLELKYDVHKRALEIPSFQFDKNTEIYARNLIALEQFHYPEDEAYITEYYFLLSLLIRGRYDVSFLVRQGIFKWVDHGIDPPTVLNKILETIDCSLKTNDYRKLAQKTNKFYKDHGTYLHTTMAKLKRDYFSTPWRGAATIGGILLLLLTVIQTVCALISVKNWK